MTARAIFTLLVFLFILLAVLIIESFADVVIETIIYESAGEQYQGQVLVASVIKQRMLERNLRGGDVVLEPGQFSCWLNKNHREYTKKEYQTALKAWTESEPMGWNHYCRYDCFPYWVKYAKEKLKVGNHIFYKL